VIRLRFVYASDSTWGGVRHSVRNFVDKSLLSHKYQLQRQLSSNATINSIENALDRMDMGAHSARRELGYPTCA